LAGEKNSTSFNNIQLNCGEIMTRVTVAFVDAPTISTM